MRLFCEHVFEGRLQSEGEAEEIKHTRNLQLWPSEAVCKAIERLPHDWIAKGCFL